MLSMRIIDYNMPGMNNDGCFFCFILYECVRSFTDSPMHVCDTLSPSLIISHDGESEEPLLQSLKGFFSDALPSTFIFGALSCQTP